MTMHDFLETDYARMRIEDSILVFQYKPTKIRGIELARRIVSDRLKFQKGRAYPVLCDARRLLDADNIARNFLAYEGTLLTKAISFLVQPIHNKARAEFFVQSNTPLVPTAIFINEEQARSFLRSYI
ncbi:MULTISPECIES: hypothetical protein [unclassified Leeuwenhoekiella]|uniref:DUF7793 family protein n=1 Tax=unclassified Leeuwenhoekiella TaxID=2615029 RepID=UPI000C4E31D0|nr:MULTISPECIES: hypothetical protein [unclassified Leeuwenhoekiella]MBA82468.1 hypothetical protein [Leeuwenhoekiella sp.]